MILGYSEELQKIPAVFVDNLGAIHRVEINKRGDMFIALDATDVFGERTGYIRFWVNPNNRFYLSEIYCFNQFRGRGIATFLNDIAEYILKDYEGYIVRGVFEPAQLSTDKLDNVYCSKEELYARAIAFYQKVGYQIITLEDYKKNPEKFFGINEIEDFQLGEEIADTIVVKVIKKQENYKVREINGVLVHDSYIEAKKTTPDEVNMGLH